MRLGLYRLYGGLGELDLCHDDSLERPDFKSHIGAAREEAGSGFGKPWQMMDARKLLINLLYRAMAQSSEVPGWSHAETKKPPEGGCWRWARRVFFYKTDAPMTTLFPVEAKLSVR